MREKIEVGKHVGEIEISDYPHGDPQAYTDVTIRSIGGVACLTISHVVDGDNVALKTLTRITLGPSSGDSNISTQRITTYRNPTE